MNYSFDLVGNILGYTNTASSFSTSQSYSYDGLYQLVSAQGTASSHLFSTTGWTSSYRQSFSFDSIGNMTAKVSTESGSNNAGEDLTYSYYAGSAHQAEIIGSLYYRYDLNGNMVEEKVGSHGSGPIPSSGKTPKGTRYFLWDEENRLERSLDNNLVVEYRYGADGQRAMKSSSKGESLYFDSMWLTQKNNAGLLQSKNVYVGSTRMATQVNQQGHPDATYERQNTFWYHPDHLGSGQLVSDFQGESYEHLEYTPYGESWVEEEANQKVELPYKFTGKELDEETGLYYYGARYLNPKTSRWISPDPAMGTYLPETPISSEAVKRNEDLPALGGVFNPLNLTIYEYATTKAWEPGHGHLATVSSPISLMIQRKVRCLPTSEPALDWRPRRTYLEIYMIGAKSTSTTIRTRLCLLLSTSRSREGMMLVWPRVLLVLIALTTLTQKAIGDVEPSIKNLLAKAYKTGDLISVEKGNFTGSGDDEYLAFYERMIVPGNKRSSKEVWGVVYVVKNNQILKTYDLRNDGLSTIGYKAIQLKTVRGTSIHFGRWAGYAYVGDYNGNGLEEILFFQLTGMSFLPVVIEFNGKEFVTVLTFETSRAVVSELDTLTRNGKKLLKIYGSGSDYSPPGKRDWALYEWDPKTQQYAVIEQGSE